MILSILQKVRGDLFRIEVVRAVCIIDPDVSFRITVLGCWHGLIVAARDLAHTPGTMITGTNITCSDV
jgi:hypothetical protein